MFKVTLLSREVSIKSQQIRVKNKSKKLYHLEQPLTNIKL